MTVVVKGFVELYRENKLPFSTNKCTTHVIFLHPHLLILIISFPPKMSRLHNSFKLFFSSYQFGISYFSTVGNTMCRLVNILLAYKYFFDVCSRMIQA